MKLKNGGIIMKRVVLSLLCILSLLITPISGKAEGIVNYWPNTFTQSSDGKVTVSPNTYSYEYFDVETFMMKKGVTSYEVQPGNTGFSSKDGVLYSVDGKKLLAYPGETVTIEDGQVYIDGEALEEDYLKSNQSGEDPWTVNAGPYEFKVPQDSYLLLGDNRNGSSDARVWEHTYVSKDDILAKAIFRYYPFNRFGAVK